MVSSILKTLPSPFYTNFNYNIDENTHIVIKDAGVKYLLTERNYKQGREFWKTLVKGLSATTCQNLNIYHIALPADTKSADTTAGVKSFTIVSEPGSVK